ncbi:5-formyltetrahydrofolate cyclo-ligase [Psychromonas sp. MB-3u-54]|uniref:5-formyltetrahydrofolate cyclo-ligase n=1 Tax=Psychromonas sp. MB-3u-54 TaxID=2058319 RepID=UPI000C339B0F|nr:5-formyltetrahydrofolate cyclo-ligase [Psychromonas sp. MB-3u-54]PKH01263.1 5-formyltetrahydrofolate cyclo-ligase [Psychromonas sp. MB-3u-54]
MNKKLSRTEIRHQIRTTRRDLSGLQQKRDADRLFSRLIKHSRVQQAGKISVTLAYDGEIDTLRFVEWCWKNNKTIYLPVIHPFHKGHLLFLEYTTKTEMVLNQHGIFEPKLNQLNTCPMNDLDLIFTPLVAFDTQGNRIGMGGGYYDRMLAPWFKDKTGPYPIGLAHDCQQIEQLPVEEWDVPLPEIITPSMHFRW